MPAATTKARNAPRGGKRKINPPPAKITAPAKETTPKAPAQPRRQLNAETLAEDFAEVLAYIDETLEFAKTNARSTARGVGARRISGIRTRVNNLQSRVSRLLSGKAPRVREDYTVTDPVLTYPVIQRLISVHFGEKVSGQDVKSGFDAKYKIATDLASFMGVSGKNPTASRNEVTKAVCAYIKSNNLQDAEHRQNINPDAALSKLLRYDQYKKDVAAGKVVSRRVVK